MAETEERVPRAASDVYRALAATGAALVGTVLAQLAYVLTGMAGDRASDLEPYVVALFAVSLVQFVTYQVLTWHAFEGLSPTELTRRVTATTARSVRARQRVALLAGGVRRAGPPRLPCLRSPRPCSSR